MVEMKTNKKDKRATLEKNLSSGSKKYAFNLLFLIAMKCKEKLNADKNIKTEPNK